MPSRNASNNAATRQVPRIAIANEISGFHPTRRSHIRSRLRFPNIENVKKRININPEKPTETPDAKYEFSP